MENKQAEIVKEKETARRPYAPPAILYQGKITTRAGSPFPIPDGSTGVTDPADLFGDE